MTRPREAASMRCSSRPCCPCRCSCYRTGRQLRGRGPDVELEHDRRLVSAGSMTAPPMAMQLCGRLAIFRPGMAKRILVCVSGCFHRYVVSWTVYSMPPPGRTLVVEAQNFGAISWRPHLRRSWHAGGGTGKIRDPHAGPNKTLWITAVVLLAQGRCAYPSGQSSRPAPEPEVEIRRC